MEEKEPLLKRLSKLGFPYLKPPSALLCLLWPLTQDDLRVMLSVLTGTWPCYWVLVPTLRIQRSPTAQDELSACLQPLAGVGDQEMLWKIITNL